MRSSLRGLTTALFVLVFVITAGSIQAAPTAQAAPAAQSAETIVDLVAGDDELATDTLTVKHLRGDGGQERLDRPGAARHLADWLTKQSGRPDAGPSGEH